VTIGDVHAVLDAVEGAGLRVWLDGGWGVDALLGEQHRSHRDVDVVVALAEVDRLVRALAPLGLAVAEDHLPTRLVLRSPDGRQVDVHPVTFDATGTGWQAGALPGGGDCPYPPAGFTRGAVGGRTVGCLSVELQIAHHSGYELDDVDRRDLRLLADRFGAHLD
jgi:lincosamide nucleotidyltransferase A/C/D/E